MKGEVFSVAKTGYHVETDEGRIFAITNNTYADKEKPVVGDFVSIQKSPYVWQ